MINIDKSLSLEILHPYIINNQVSLEQIDTIINSHRYGRLDTGTQLNIKNEQELLTKLYQLAHWPWYKIGMLFNVSDVTAKRYGVQYNIEPCATRGKNSNNTFFHQIDTPAKAYFLGLWFADGSVGKYKTSYNVGICLTQDDSYILEKFLSTSNLVGKIYTTHSQDNHPRCQLNISSKTVYDDLVRLGCIQDKSHAEHLNIPQLAPSFISHFIRGYFDGDGIAFTNQRLGFCGHRDILKYIQQQLDIILKDSKVSITYNKSNHIYYLIYNKQEHVSQILDYIYDNCEDLFLKRKYTKYRPLL